MRWIAQTVRRREPRESRAAVRPNEQTNRGKAISPPTSESFEGIGINAHVEIDTGAQGDARPASIVGDLYRTERERERERERDAAHFAADESGLLGALFREMLRERFTRYSPIVTGHRGSPP
jgi:hypothetical protein